MLAVHGHGRRPRADPERHRARGRRRRGARRHRRGPVPDPAAPRGGRLLRGPRRGARALARRHEQAPAQLRAAHRAGRGARGGRAGREGRTEADPHDPLRRPPLAPALHPRAAAAPPSTRRPCCTAFLRPRRARPGPPRAALLRRRAHLRRTRRPVRRPRPPPRRPRLRARRPARGHAPERAAVRGRAARRLEGRRRGRTRSTPCTSSRSWRTSSPTPGWPRSCARGPPGTATSAPTAAGSPVRIALTASELRPPDPRRPPRPDAPARAPEPRPGRRTPTDRRVAAARAAAGPAPRRAAPRGRRHRADQLHLGHQRPPQGRAQHARQHLVQRPPAGPAARPGPRRRDLRARAALPHHRHGLPAVRGPGRRPAPSRWPTASSPAWCSTPSASTGRPTPSARPPPSWRCWPGPTPPRTTSRPSG